MNIAKQQDAISHQVLEQKTLIDGIVQSANQYTTKDDLNKFIQQHTSDLKAIQDNLTSLGAQITAANVIVSDSQGQTVNNLPSSGTGITNPHPSPPTIVNCPGGGTISCPNSDPFGYQQNQQTLALNEDFNHLQVPLGNVSFSAWEQKPWSINILSREYQIANVIGTDENQRIYVDNKFSVKVGDKIYNLPIASAQTQQIFPSPKWSFFNPQLFIGLDGGIGLTNLPKIQGEFAPNINIGIISYGKYRTQPDLSLLQIGAAYESISKRAALVITPVALNLGTVIPLIHNTYIGPSVHISTDGNVYGELGLRLGL